MELKLKSLYEPLDIKIEGAGTVHASVDVSADGLLDLAEKCIGAQEKMQETSKLLEEARRRKDATEIKRLNAKAAKVIRGALDIAIGPESVEEVLLLASGGRSFSDSAAIELLGEVLVAVSGIVMGRYEARMDEKAAHYLSEVANAQPEPNAAD